MDVKGGPDKSIQFELSRNEALVFFEWLSRFTAKDRLEHYEHGSEEQLLFDFEVSLEKLLIEPFRENYSQVVKIAQEKVFPTE